MSTGDLDDVRRRMVALEARVTEHAGLLDDARRALAAARGAWRLEADEAVREAAQLRVRHTRRERKGAEANAQEAQTAALRVIMNALSANAPGFLSADWDSGIWSRPADPMGGQWVRTGTFRSGSGSIPVITPMSAGHWTVRATSATMFKSLVHHVFVRMVGAFGARRIRAIVWDPSLELDMAIFAPLRAVSALSVPQAMTAPEELDDALVLLRRELAALQDRVQAGGQSSFWAAEAAGHLVVKKEPVRLLILAGDPDRLPAHTAERLEQVQDAAARTGLLIIQRAHDATGPRGRRGVVIDVGDPSSSSDLGAVTWQVDPWLGIDRIQTIARALAARPQEDLAPVVPFRDLVEAIPDAWMAQVDEGMEAVVGRVDDRDLVVRLRSENPPMPNVLVGGAVGQGKSNLLLVLVHSLAARYSPAELEMVLIDLKDGVEFARFAPAPGRPHWLPHVRALGLEFDPDYSLAALRWVTDQMRARSAEMKRASVSTLGEYRARTGQVMPRLVMVIDEFQRLFEGDDEQVEAAGVLLESISRTGRSLGVHLVLASQAISGIRGLMTRSDAIFGQFHNRISLKNTVGESRAFLSLNNIAAAELEHRGQAVVNDSLGAEGKNTVGTIAYASSEYLMDLQEELHGLGHTRPPHVFRSSAYATWRKEFQPGRAAGPAVVVGMPIAVDPEPMGTTMLAAPNQGLAVVGSERAVAVRILVRAVMTAVASSGPGVVVTLLDGESGTLRPARWIQALAERLERHSAAVEIVPPDLVPEVVLRLEDDNITSTRLVVGVGLDSVDLGTPQGPNYEVPGDSLRALLKTGSLRRTWFMGWWQSKTVMEEHLGYRAPGIRTWAFAGVSREDLVDVAGHSARAGTAAPRFVYYDRTSGHGARRLVPFESEDVVGVFDDVG